MITRKQLLGIPGQYWVNQASYVIFSLLLKYVVCPPQVNPLRGVLPYAEFPNGGEPITKEPDTKSGSLAKNALGSACSA